MIRAGRLHAPTLDVLVDPPVVRGDHPVIALRAPRPGIFVPAVDHGDLVVAGSAIGELVVLGRSIGLIAPRVTGFAIQLIDGATTQISRRPVAYGDVLFGLDPSQARMPTAGDAAADPSALPAAGGLVFRAPTSGRFYSRSAPDKPAFVAAGSQLSQGTTICLLEVMKTFSRITYGGPGLPDTARVSRVLVADGADVSAGEPLLALE
jgi:biotin carboxyl carrier protein